jgi:CRP/FNR family transcriptional regulator, cyclic AMP receptor protein
MRTANGFEIQENCLTCQWRQDKWFCGFSRPGVRRLQRIASLRTHPACTVLYSEGQAPDGIFILCNGKAKISMASTRGNVVMLKVAEKGETLGLEAVLANRPHEETAELLNSCQVKFVPGEEVLPYLTAHNEAALKAALQLNANCRAAREQIRHIGFSVSGREKLARLLIAWTNAGKSDQRQGKTVQVPFTHQEIAQMIGSTRETITRVLNHWKRNKVIEVHGKTFIMKNIEEIERLVNE